MWAYTYCVDYMLAKLATSTFIAISTRVFNLNHCQNGVNEKTYPTIQLGNDLRSALPLQVAECLWLTLLLLRCLMGYLRLAILWLLPSISAMWKS